MRSTTRDDRFGVSLLTLGVVLVCTAALEGAFIGANRCRQCPPVSCLTAGSSCLSISEGNLQERYPIVSVRSAFGPTIELSLTYNSFNADGSRANLDTVLGYGWTHSYNQFLFDQFGHMFRMDGEGGVIRYRRAAGDAFVTDTGYFETLEQISDTAFRLMQKDGTVLTFELQPGTPFLVNGPVYRLTSVEDTNNTSEPGRRPLTTLEYTNGCLTSLTDTYLRQVTFTYNAHGKVQAVTDPLGRTTTFAYDPTGRQLRTLTDATGARATNYTYNSLYQLATKLDRDGRKFTYPYANLKPVGILDGAGRALFRLSNTSNWATDAEALAKEFQRVYVPSRTTHTDGLGRIWQYDYDEHGYITQVIAPDNATTTYTYDSTTLMLRSVLGPNGHLDPLERNANGHTVTYEYDAFGNRTKVIDALNHETTFTYEPTFSRLTSTTDPNNRTTIYDYDDRGNRIRETDPLLQTREWGPYDVHGNVASEQDKRGSVTDFLYDAFGNHEEMTQDAGAGVERLNIVTRYEYDEIGNMIRRKDANGHTTRFDYDELDRTVGETVPEGDPLERTTQASYDGEGNRTRVTDRNGHTTESVYDLRARLVKTIDVLPDHVTDYKYDGNNNRVSVTDRNRNTTTLGYDAQNRLIRITDVLKNATVRSYDPAGNLIGETDANGHITRYEYDALNRRTQRTDPVTLPNGNASVWQFGYDLVGTSVCAECTGPTQGSSLVTKQTDGNGKVTYFFYDGLDRVKNRCGSRGTRLIQRRMAWTTRSRRIRTTRTTISRSVASRTASQ